MRLLSVFLVLSVECAALGSFTSASPAQLVDFDAWRSEHGKVFGSEEGLRREAFAANVAWYTIRNAEEGQHGARFGPDFDSDLTPEERKKRSCFTPSAQQPIQVGSLPASLSSATIDWRTHGAVTPVQQQHPFGTCWAFAAVAALEGIAVVQGKQPLQKLSEQQLISCSPAKDAGQDSPVLWQFLKDHTHGSLSTEETYPYNRTCNSFREQLLAPDGTRDGYMENCTLKLPPPNGPCPPCPGVQRPDGAPKCQTLATNSHAKVSNWSFVGSAKDGNDDAVVAALLKYGPGTLGIDATCVLGYKSGVITKCASKNVDHAVTLVGAGNTAAGIPYWIVKNSWNTTFGDNGYFRVERNKNLMGINGAQFGCFSPGCSISLGDADESVVV